MFDFAFPWILLILPLPWLIRKIIPPAAVAVGNALKVPFFYQLQSLISQQQIQAKTVLRRKPFVWFIWGLLVLAAAGPQWYGVPIPLERSGRNIFLALDVSGSMQIPDMRLNNRTVDRLTVVKAVADQFVAQRKGDRLGLILFGSKAYLQTPLTFDRKTVQYMLNDATVGLAGERTAIGDAIGIAIKRLRKISATSRVLILLTDGANNEGALEPLEAAKIAAKEKIRIYTIGIGAYQVQSDQLNFLSRQIINPSADLDEKTLKTIAQMTGGIFFRAANTEELQQVYQQIDRLEPTIDKPDFFRPITPYYYWPFGLALLLSIGLAVKSVVPAEI